MNVPFFVAAPSTTFDLKLQTGEEIPIEERDENEILQPFGFQSTPAMARGFNPAFDVTPADLITAIITERGIIKNVTMDTVAAVISN